MQTLREIQALLGRADARPMRRFGQCFLIDLNLMRKLLETAALPGEGATVLEVGPGTGSLTEELLQRSARLVAVEIDHSLAGLLRDQLTGPAEPEPVEIGQHRWLVARRGEEFVLIEGDILADKSTIAPPVLAELGTSAHLVANLPYNIATPLVAECMLETWQAARTGRGVRFESLTVTVQQEVAQRFAASAGRQFGPVSVVLSLLGRVTLGPVIPAGAFWPRPKVASQIVRVDFDASAGRELRDAAVLRALLSMAFTQRRKRISSTSRSRGAPFGQDVFAEALARAGVDGARRADQITAREYLALANILAGG